MYTLHTSVEGKFPRYFKIIFEHNIVLGVEFSICDTSKALNHGAFLTFGL